MVTENQLQKMPESDVACLRCETLMREGGEIQFQVGGVPILFPNLGMHHFPLQAYICPRCGKVEFFL